MYVGIIINRYKDDILIVDKYHSYSYYHITIGNDIIVTSDTSVFYKNKEEMLTDTKRDVKMGFNAKLFDGFFNTLNIDNYEFHLGNPFNIHASIRRIKIEKLLKK